MKTTKNPLVCFFDSGIGGLNLLYECVIRLPCVDFIYFADNYRVPYGNLGREKILKYTEETFDKIAAVKPAAAVAACNTVTAQCIENLRNKYPFEIIGIQPAVKPAAAIGGKCLVLATKATAGSEPLKRLVSQYGNGNAEIYACADLAEYIEKNIFDLKSGEVEKLLPEVAADSVVLGCTHYVYIKEVIEKYYNCPVFDGIIGTADRLRAKIGISDHIAKRAQKVTFEGGDCIKNRTIFSALLRLGGKLSQEVAENLKNF